MFIKLEKYDRGLPKFPSYLGQTYIETSRIIGVEPVNNPIYNTDYSWVVLGNVFGSSDSTILVKGDPKTVMEYISTSTGEDKFKII